MRENCLLHYFMYAPQSIVHAQVLVTIERNDHVTQVFQQSLPTSNEFELLDAVRREVNSAMQEVLEEMEQEFVKWWTNLRVSQSQGLPFSDIDEQ